MASSGQQQPEQRSLLGFPERPGGDGGAVQAGRHYWYDLAGEIQGAFADIDRAIAGMQWSGDARNAFDAVWAQFKGHGTEASQHSHEMGDHLFTLGGKIDDAQHEWDLAMAAMAASTAIGIGLTFVTFGISDAVAEGAAAAAVGTMEAVCTALDISIEAAVQVLLAAVRVAVQLAVKFTWQFAINVVSQEAANAVEGRGLDNVNLLQAAEFAGVSMVIPGMASRVTIGGRQVLAGIPGTVLAGSATDAAVQGLEGATEGKPFNLGEVLLSGALAAGGAKLGERLMGQGASPGDPRFSLEPDPAQAELAGRRVASWGPSDTAGHTSEARVVTYEDGSTAYFKPYSGEDTAGRQTFEAGTLWRNEVGVHEVDKALGFRLTATTTAVEAPIGPNGELVRGSLAAHAGTDEPGAFFHPLDQQRAAVLHYVTGNTDGHSGNVLVQPDGRPAIIDGGLALPRGAADPLRSRFFPDVVGRHLDPSVVHAVRGVDEEQLASRLRDAGIPRTAINGVMARLHEVQGGRITGSAFRGKLVGGGWLEWDEVPKPHR